MKRYRAENLEDIAALFDRMAATYQAAAMSSKTKANDRLCAEAARIYSDCAEILRNTELAPGA